MTYVLAFLGGAVVMGLIWWVKAKGKSNVIGDVEKAASEVEKKV